MQEDDRPARLGLARALAWSGRFEDDLSLLEPRKSAKLFSDRIRKPEGMIENRAKEDIRVDRLSLKQRR